MAVDGIVAAEYLLTQIGESYKKQDCIKAVVVNVIRKCAGGNKFYRTAGCTELWNSYDKSGKYHHITERMTLADAKKKGLKIGDLPVIYNEDTGKCEHIAYYMGGIGGYECIHSSATKGEVCGTTLKNGFTHVLRHRDITGRDVCDYAGCGLHDVTPDEDDDGVQLDVMAYGKVTTNGGHLNLRSGPSTKKAVLTEIPFGTTLPIYESVSGWHYVEYNGEFGYVSADYIIIEETPKTEVSSGATCSPDGGSNIWGVFIFHDSKEAAEEAVEEYLNAIVCQYTGND